MKSNYYSHIHISINGTEQVTHGTCTCILRCYRDHDDRTDCVDDNTRQRVVRACQDNHSCVVPATNDYFGDPCEGTYKYLDVVYECNCAGEILLLCTLCIFCTIIYDRPFTIC